MACYHPIPAIQDEPGVKPRFNVRKGEETLTLPCQKCLGCKSAYATQWANRCVHEASEWDFNSFLTLTYDDDHVPPALRPDHLQKFVKRLRKRASDSPRAINRDRSHGIRVFACGEYGSQQQRPHYHLLLFNCAFPDQLLAGRELYESPLVNDLWKYGSNRIGEVNARSANYVAQYSLKKQAPRDYGAYKVMVVDPETGELLRYSTRYRVQPPFLRMSTRPAIGLRWLTRYSRDLEPGYLVEEGGQHTIPRYYRKKIKEEIRIPFVLPPAADPALNETIEYNIEQHRIKNPNDRDLVSAEKIHQRLKYLSENRNQI